MDATYSSVGSLLLFVPLLVSRSLGLVGSLLLLVQALPLLSEELADLAYRLGKQLSRAWNIPMRTHRT